MPFYKIRRHVLRAEHRLDYAEDSPPSDEEHLMIMLFDLLLLDYTHCLVEPYERRRQRLDAMIQPSPGRAEIGSRFKIDFGRHDAADQLGNMMTTADSRGWEGLVIKTHGEPYLLPQGKTWQVKLKRDYVPGLADSVDLVVVGGRRDAKVVRNLGLRNLSWTTFFLACLDNKNDMRRCAARPYFHTVGTVMRPCVSIKDVKRLNELGRSCRLPFARCRTEMEVHTHFSRLEQPTELFETPIVVEVIEAGFDRPSNARFLSLRFPRIQKIHEDRSFLDTPSFVEYQQLATETMKTLHEASQTTNNFQSAEVHASCIPESATLSDTSTVRSIPSLGRDIAARTHSRSIDEPSGYLFPSEFKTAKRRLTASDTVPDPVRAKQQRTVSFCSLNTSSTSSTSTTLTTSDPVQVRCPTPRPSESSSTGFLIHKSLSKTFLQPDCEFFHALSQTPIKSHVMSNGS